ncbi:siderophore-interacting protein [Limoniibacter endophyticus]|uniref:Siderophore-interacting protein n=1 Tax=Limoniibacter endophyticus TaxID=1565040 RepID=A0A8J3DLF1_9HYPH|nr:siderophore-interacting protein [Limoniibacter endophyticus]GHC64078.1 siderophore-interacting protein [Limoniibacter endophyticus]
MTDMPAPTTRPSGRPNLRSWTLEVVESFNVEPSMRRVVFTARDITELGESYKPGQALVLFLPLGDGASGRRDYTIRGYDSAKGQISIDFFLHGDTPAPVWASNVKSGETIEAKGPRGNCWLREGADWHLMTGDETCLPAIAHILETAPVSAKFHVFVETADKSGEIDLPSKASANIRWLHRGTAPRPSELMADAIAHFELPAGNGHAYIIGETSNVRRQRQNLVARGMEKSAISSEGYWRPGRIGGHDHVED